MAPCPVLIPIGSPREQPSTTAPFSEHREALDELEASLRQRRAESRPAGATSTSSACTQGQAHRPRAGRPPHRPRHPRLRGRHLRQRRRHFRRQPALARRRRGHRLRRVEGRWCMVIANDNTVASGSWWPQDPREDRARADHGPAPAPAHDLPRRLLRPVPPRAVAAFPGATGAGHIFKMNSLLSANGVPQLAGVFGDCIAGGGYMPIISDRVYMTEQAYMVIAGAALIKGAKSLKMTSLDIGGPEVHVHQSGCADVRVPRRRGPDRLPAPRGRPPAQLRRRLLPRRRRRHRAEFPPPTSSAASSPAITARATTPTRSSPACATRACSGRSCPSSARR
jgi:3-methylcrotonyl-CoA carboxylase beta subunit